MSRSEKDQPAVGPRKNEKRRVSLDGQDPIEVLKRLLDAAPQKPAGGRKRRVPKPPQTG